MPQPPQNPGPWPHPEPPGPGPQGPRDPREPLLIDYTNYLIAKGLVTQTGNEWEVAVVAAEFLLTERT